MSASFRFLHAADIHLDSPLRGLEAYEDAPLEELRAASRRAFDNLIELAIDEGVDFLLIVGDLYDGDWKDYNTGLFFASRMGRLEQAGIRVFMVSGNHDAASQISATLPLPANVTVFSHKKAETVLLDDLGVALHGQSYPTRAVTDNLATGYPPPRSGFFNIGLLHTSLTGRPGHEPYAPCSIDELTARGYGYWALGHVHQREVVREEPLILFPGSIQGRHIRETGEKSATLVSVEGGRIAEVDERAVDVLRWSLCRVALGSCETELDIHQAVREAMERERDRAAGRTVALRLELTGACPLHSQLLERIGAWTDEFRAVAAGLDGVWLEKVRSTTSPTGSIEELDQDGPIAGLLQAVDSLDLDAEALDRLVPELSGLRNKLPAELLSGEEPFPDSSPEALAALRREVRELLVGRLLRGEVRP